jgi:hypothetical protein
VPLRGDFKAQLLTKFDREEVELAFGGTLDLAKNPPPQALPYQPISVTSILSAQKARQTREQRNGGDMNNAHRPSPGESDSRHVTHHHYEHPKSTASNGSILSSAAELRGKRTANVKARTWTRLRVLVFNAAVGVLLSLGGRILFLRHVYSNNGIHDERSERVGIYAAVIGVVMLCLGYIDGGSHDTDESSGDDDDDAFAVREGRDTALLKRRLEAEAKGKLLGGWLSSCIGVYARLSMSV